jgi:arginine deiminase
VFLIYSLAISVKPRLFFRRKLEHLAYLTSRPRRSQVLNLQAVIVHTPGAATKHGLYHVLDRQLRTTIRLIARRRAYGDSQNFVTLRLQHIGVILCYTKQPGKETTGRQSAHRLLRSDWNATQIPELETANAPREASQSISLTFPDFGFGTGKNSKLETRN